MTHVGEVYEPNQKNIKLYDALYRDVYKKLYKKLKPLYERITDARLDNGHLIEADTKYKVAGWAQVNRTPEGRLMWDVVRDYILKNKGKDNILKLAKINHPKLGGVMKDPGIADYPGEAS